MKNFIFAISIAAIFLLVACSTPSTQVLAPTQNSIIIGSYRPVQTGDTIEGVNIGYQYILPSQERPVLVIAASQFLLHFITIKEEMKNGLVAYAQDLPKGNNINAFDENDTKQSAPKLMTWDASKPVEIVFIPLPEDQRTWSVTEEDENGIQAAYKIVRRKDGGLRFIDAYGKNALYSSEGLVTIYGSGLGLMLSARLALLRTILTNPNYQRGKNVMITYPPDYAQYDSRVLILDPSKEGLQVNRDWVLMTLPGPNPGMVAP